MDPVEYGGLLHDGALVRVWHLDENRFEFLIALSIRGGTAIDRYDRDLIELGWRGNGHPDIIGRPMSFSGMGVNAQTYLGPRFERGAMAKEDKLWLGWGIHILNGVGPVQTGHFDATWMTDTLDYSWTLDGAATFNRLESDLDSLVRWRSGGSSGRWRHSAHHRFRRGI